MSWFLRGVQSAIFYYLSCAPCTTWAYERKQQKANRRAVAEREGLEAADDGVYRHPLPLNANAGWMEEMTLGPGPPPRKGTKERAKTESARRLNTGGQDSSFGGSSADTTLIVDSMEKTEAKFEMPNDSWNKRRYQRPDEPLWGMEDTSRQQDGTQISRSGSLKKGSGTYFALRNPAVNDLHPPVVSTPPARKEEIRWMLQPPPPAKVMEGKEPANLSRTVSKVSMGSYGSRRRRAGQSSNTLVEKEGMKSNISGQAHDRDSRPSTASSGKSSRATPQKRRPPPIHISEDSPSSSTKRGNRIIRAHSSRSAKATSPDQRAKSVGRRNRRPELSTIDSMSSSGDGRGGRRTIENTLHVPVHNVFTSSSSSLVALQELVSTKYLQAAVPPLSTKSTSSKPTKDNEAENKNTIPTAAAMNIRLPSASYQEEQDLLSIPSIDTKFPGAKTFRFPPSTARGDDLGGFSSADDEYDEDEQYEWEAAAAGTAARPLDLQKRTLRERWSMDMIYDFSHVYSDARL